MNTDILVVGGYGVVGRRIAAELAPRFAGRVVVAGRDQDRAAVFCRELGHGARPRRVDVNDPASLGPALEGVGTVMSCVAERERHLLRASIERGLAYTDIAPGLAFWHGAEELRGEARRTGARVLLGAGLSPGISNMMARQLGDLLGRVERIETAILLSLGDEYGADSLSYVLEEFTKPWTVVENGQPRQVVPFSEGRRVQFPAPFGARTAYLFPWSDVVYYSQTLGAHTALGRFALDPPWVGGLLSSLLCTRLRRWLERPGFVAGNRRATKQLQLLYAKHDGFALVVTAASGERLVRASLAGRRQADATAIAAAEFVRLLATDEIKDAGVWLPEEIVVPERFFAALSAHGYKPTMEELTAESTPLHGSSPVIQS